MASTDGVVAPADSPHHAAAAVYMHTGPPYGEKNSAHTAAGLPAPESPRAWPATQQRYHEPLQPARMHLPPASSESAYRTHAGVHGDGESLGGSARMVRTRNTAISEAEEQLYRSHSSRYVNDGIGRAPAEAGSAYAQPAPALRPLDVPVGDGAVPLPREPEVICTHRSGGGGSSSSKAPNVAPAQRHGGRSARSDRSPPPLKRQNSQRRAPSRRTSVSSEGEMVWAQAPAVKRPAGSKKSRENSAPRTSPTGAAVVVSASAVAPRGSAAPVDRGRGGSSDGRHGPAAAPLVRVLPVSVAPPTAPPATYVSYHSASSASSSANGSAESPTTAAAAAAASSRYNPANFARSVDDVLKKYGVGGAPAAFASSSAAAAVSARARTDDRPVPAVAPVEEGTWSAPGASASPAGTYDAYYADYNGYTALPRSFVSNTAVTCHSRTAKAHLLVDGEDARSMHGARAGAPRAGRGAAESHTVAQRMQPLVAERTITFAPRQQTGRSPKARADSSAAREHPPRAHSRRTTPPQKDAPVSYTSLPAVTLGKAHEGAPAPPPRAEPRRPPRAPSHPRSRSRPRGHPRGQRKKGHHTSPSPYARVYSTSRTASKRKSPQSDAPRHTRSVSSPSSGYTATAAAAADPFAHLLCRHGFWGEAENATKTTHKDSRAPKTRHA